MSDRRDPPDGPETRPIEHALRLLDGEELRHAQSLEAADSTFAAEAGRWRGRFALMYAEIEAVTPPSSVWKRIEAQAVGRSSAANDNIGAVERRLSLWRSAAGAMAAIAAGLALLLAFEPRSSILPGPPRQSAAAPMVAMLGDDKAIKVVASWDPAGKQLVLAVAGDMPPDPRHAHELWVIPPGGKPRSLGTMPAGKQMHMTLADALAALLRQGAIIAVSVEPPGGSPTGAPTGPVVASGSLTEA